MGRKGGKEGGRKREREAEGASVSASVGGRRRLREPSVGDVIGCPPAA